MPGFIVDSAVTRLSRDPEQGRPGRTAGVGAGARVLEVEGPAAAGGRNRARFLFSADIDVRHPAPVGTMTDRGKDGLSLIGWLPACEFEVYREIVESGVPLRVHYETRDGGPGYLRRLALGRLDAPPIVAAACRRPLVRAGGAAPVFGMPR